MPDDMIERWLPETELLVGQTALSAARLERAPKLRAVFNVETNFLPTIDYGACQARGIWVLTPAAAFAGPVAEAALGMAIDLARGITAADRAFRTRRELYGLAGNADSFRFAGAPVGIIGFGDLGRELRKLIVPFDNPVFVHDPWLPDELIRQHHAQPVGLDDLLRRARVVFVFAAVTSDNQGLLGAREFALMQPNSAFLLMSRAGIVDFPALLAAVGSGRIRAAIDVFPEEPVSAQAPFRDMPGLLLSAHRAGGTLDAMRAIGRMVVADAELIRRGLPPQLCRRADPVVASRLRSKPVAIS
jgi:phosphoglycerate dehydrogenase-like enzyme